MPAPQRTDTHGRPRWLPSGWGLVALGTAGLIVLAALTWLGLAGTHSPVTGPAAPAGRASPAELNFAGGPASPPVRICGNAAILGGGPASPPAGAVVIPAGDDSDSALMHTWTVRPDTTYWFGPGRHTLGAGQYSQIAPASGDTFIGAPGAILDGQHENLYAFTGQASNVTIRYLTIQNFGPRGANGGQGVVNHDEGSGWHIDHVTVQGNAGGGVMLGSGNVLAYSCLKGNGEYGFQGGGAHLIVDHNEVTGNNTDNWEVRQPGCGCTGGAKFWGANGAVITSNYVHGNLGPGLWADTNNRGFDVEHNYFADNQGEGFIYEISYNLRLASNTFIRNALKAGPNVDGFPASRGLHFRVRRRQPGPGAIREHPGDHQQHLYGQLERRGPLGERRSVLRLASQHLNRGMHPGRFEGGDHKLVQSPAPRQRAVLRRLPLEDAERTGQSQLLQLQSGPHRPELHAREILRLQRDLQ